MRYITSDLRFSHESILKWTDTRPFGDVEEMDNFLLHTLNNLKGLELLYHVGDFYLGKKKDLEHYTFMVIFMVLLTLRQSLEISLMLDLISINEFYR